MGDGELGGNGQVVTKVVRLALAEVKGGMGHESVAKVGNEGAYVCGDSTAAEDKAAGDWGNGVGRGELVGAAFAAGASCFAWHDESFVGAVERERDVKLEKRMERKGNFGGY